MTVAKLHFVVLHRGLVVCDGPFVLGDDGALIRDGLFGNRVIVERVLVPLQIRPCLLKRRLTATKRGLRLFEMRFSRPGIDFDEHLALADDLALLIVHRQHAPADLAVHVDGGLGCHSTPSRRDRSACRRS